MEEWATTALPLVVSIKDGSQLRDLWAESPHLAKWERELTALADDLRPPAVAATIGKSARPAVKKPAKRPCRHQWTAGDVFRLALPNGEFAWGRMYEPNQFGIYNHFSRDREAAPVGSRDFFHFFRFYNDQYKSPKLVYVGRDPFAPGAEDWQPMFGLQFPSFQWIRPSRDAKAVEFHVAPTDKVVGLCQDGYRSIASLMEILVERDSPAGQLRLYPNLPTPDGELRRQPWSAWPAIRERFLKKYGPDYEEILRDRVLQSGPPKPLI